MTDKNIIGDSRVKTDKVDTLCVSCEVTLKDGSVPKSFSSIDLKVVEALNCEAPANFGLKLGDSTSYTAKYDASKSAILSDDVVKEYL